MKVEPWMNRPANPAKVWVENADRTSGYEFVSPGLTKLEWMAGMVVSGVESNASIDLEGGQLAECCVDRAMLILAACREANEQVK